MTSLIEEDWSCYRGGHSWTENGHVTDVASLRMGENGHVTEVTLVEIEGHVTEVVNLERKNGHTDVVSFMEGVVIYRGTMEGEWSSYRGGQFKGGRMVMLWRCPE